jgi:sulfur relay (sulfurtransferase) complex TusBCD TusD component (DsrE family)
MDARALLDPELLKGSRRSNLDELTELALAADKVLVF